MAGILYGVGVGPGDPELLTVKALNVIRNCDIIAVPAKSADSCTAYQIVRKAFPEAAEKPVLAIPIPMATEQEVLEKAYAKGCGLIQEQLMKNLRIAFLNLGDPTIYGSYMGIHKRIAELGFETEIISGVPSFCAAAAALGIALASGRETMHILPGLYQSERMEAYDGTKILMKSAGKLPEVKQKLKELEDEGKILAYAVTNCGMMNETRCRNIRELDENAGYFTTIIVKDNHGE